MSCEPLIPFQDVVRILRSVSNIYSRLRCEIKFLIGAFVARICQPSEASNAQKIMAAVSANSSTICAVILRLNSSGELFDRVWPCARCAIGSAADGLR